jgi:hypothetical protein
MVTLEKKSAYKPVEGINSICFDKKDSEIKVDEKNYTIPKDTNQFYLCKALFSNLKKEWEQDEILEIMGESFSAKNTRKIYDAKLAINKKIGIKLIEHENKKYFISKSFIEKIKSVNA